MPLPDEREDAPLELRHGFDATKCVPLATSVDRKNLTSICHKLEVDPREWRIVPSRVPLAPMGLACVPKQSKHALEELTGVLGQR